MKWSDIQHQEAALTLLQRALASGRTHHAFLFEGPEGVGKELTARVLAARLLCLAHAEPDGNPPDAAAAGALPGFAAEPKPPAADPCGICTSCRLLAAGNHPDFTVIERELRKFHPDRAIRASKGLFLGVDLVRHFLIEPAGRKPSQGPRRVFLIREAERLNEEAQNALLKTLEEPPGQSVLILITSSAMRLLPTIRSRCQTISFRWLPPKFVAEELIRRARLAAEPAETLAALSGGRLGAALRWHAIGLLRTLESVSELLDRDARDDPERFAKEIAELAAGVAERTQRLAGAGGEEDIQEEDEVSGDADDAPRSVKKIPTDEYRDALKLVLLLLAAVLHDRLLAAAGARPATRMARDPRHETASELIGLETGIRAVADTERLLDRNVAPQLALERLAVLLHGDFRPIRL